MRFLRIFLLGFILFISPFISSEVHAYSKLSFPSSERSKFLRIVMGVDHDPNSKSFGVKCLNYKGNKYFPHCYGRHRGSDFALRGGFHSMEKGVNVRAAAGGVVTFVEDAQGDHCRWAPFTERGIKCKDNPTIRPNYIAILQDDGLTAYYFHLRKNSAVVHEGDRVECGDWIAQVGSSGISSIPHLHFELRWIDPELKIKSGDYEKVIKQSKLIDPYLENLWAERSPRGLPEFRCVQP